MSKAEEYRITPEILKEFDLSYLIGKHVKLAGIGWTKVYHVKALRIPGDDTVTLVLNEPMKPMYGTLTGVMSEPNPTIVVKKSRWWKW